MKIKAGIITLILCLSISLSAQKFQGGVFAGMNASQVDGDGYSGFNKLGLNAGAFVSREIIENFNWQMELKYSTRGMYNYQIFPDPSINVSNLIYLELPLSVHYFYSEKIQIELGIALDVLLKESYGDENSGISIDQANDLRKFGLNVFCGVFYYFKKNIAAGVRYTYSAIPFYPFDAYAIRYRDSGLFHDVLSLSVKYYLVR